MFGFKKVDRPAEIEAALQKNWIEFAAGAAVGIELSIVLRAEGEVPEDVHYALRAEKRDHVIDMIKTCVGETIALSDAEIHTLAHRIQSAAMERIEGAHPELEVGRILSGETGMFVDPLVDILSKAMP
jgi:hypothetical protein